MSKTPKYVKDAVNKYRKKFDVVQIRLDKGTNERIESLGFQKSEFINNLVTSELDKLESGKKEVRKPQSPKPKGVNGKPVYEFWKENDYIKHGGEWWHDIIFFYDDMELNDLFIKSLDKLAAENDNHKDGCRIWFDLVNLSRTTGKYSDKELFDMTNEELDKIPEEDFEPIGQTEKLKELLKDFVYNDNDKPLFEFIGFYDFLGATK